MSFTYTTLTAEIQAWAENDATEFTARIPTIISLAELRINRETDLDKLRKYSTTSLVLNDRFLSKPTDMVIDRWIKVKDDNDDYQHVHRKDTSFIEEYWPDVTNTGLPKFYSDWDDNTFVLTPSCDATRTLELAYTYRPTGLTASNATTWLGTNAYDVLLWACLVEAAAFMKELPADADTWEKKYVGARDALMLEELKRNRRDEARHGEARG